MMILKMSSYAPHDVLGKVPKNSDFQNVRRRFKRGRIFEDLQLGRSWTPPLCPQMLLKPGPHHTSLGKVTPTMHSTC